MGNRCNHQCEKSVEQKWEIYIVRPIKCLRYLIGEHTSYRNFNKKTIFFSFVVRLKINLPKFRERIGEEGGRCPGH